MSKTPRFFGWASLLGALALSGCCGGKVKQCNKLIKVINDNGTAIKAATAKMSAAKDDTKAIEEVAVTMEKAADDIKKVEVDDETLKGHAKEYETMLRNGAKAAKEMVAAAKGSDLGALQKATAEISKVETTEAALVSKVNGYCQP